MLKLSLMNGKGVEEGISQVAFHAQLFTKKPKRRRERGTVRVRAGLLYCWGAAVATIADSAAIRKLTKDRYGNLHDLNWGSDISAEKIILDHSSAF